jgi:hypothetical protein
MMPFGPRGITVRFSRERAQLLIPVAAVLVVVVATRTNFAGTAGKVFAIVPLVAIGTLVPRRYRIGAFVGLAVVGGIDSLPGPDLDTLSVKFGLYAQAVIVIALCLCLTIVNARRGFGRLLGTTIGQAIVVSSLALAGWWLVVLYRTEAQGISSITHAASFGRDFLTFALAVPLLAGVLQRENVRNAMVVTVACFTVPVAAAYVVTSLSHGAIPTLLHTTNTLQLGGITRVYAPAEDLFSAALPLAVGAVLLGPDRRIRRAGAVIAVFTLPAVIIELTRAQYVGSGVGLIVTSLVWLVRSGEASRMARRRLTRTLVVVAVSLGIVVLYSPNGKVAHGLAVAGARLTSITSAVGSNNPTVSTVAVRNEEVSLLDQRLDGHSVFGLGFIDPRDQYDASLPSGTIRNSDVGFLNVTLTMGIVGTILYYIPLLMIALALGVRGRGRWSTSVGWLGFGVFGWCVTSVITSVTLVTLFSPTGVVSAAVMLGLGTAVLLHSSDDISEVAR